MKKDEWILSKELGRLRKLGFYLQAERIIENERYNVVFEKSREILEPNCSIEEILAIANSLDICLRKLYEYQGVKINEGDEK